MGVGLGLIGLLGKLTKYRRSNIIYEATVASYMTILMLILLILYKLNVDLTTNSTIRQ